jgi:hypothetical protein
MENNTLLEFQRVLMNESEVALLASDEIEKYADSGEPHSQTRLWYSVHAFLVTSANVSKLLWPERYSRKTHERIKTPIPERGVELRGSLGINSDSVLRPRKARDYFEHFDEKLESWLSKPNHIVADGNTWKSPRKDLPKFVLPLRNFDSKGFAVLYGREAYPLRPVIAALRKLHNEAFKQFSDGMSASNRVLTPSGDNR